LDLTHTPGQQVEEFHVVEAKVPWIDLIEWHAMLITVRQLHSTFPDFFEGKDGETRLDLAKQMISAYHGRRQFESKHQRQPVELTFIIAYN
jgi:hypothetical protein